MTAKSIVVTAHASPGDYGGLLARLSEQVQDTSVPIIWDTNIRYKTWDAAGGAALRLVCNNDSNLNVQGSLWEIWTVVNGDAADKAYYNLTTSLAAQVDLSALSVATPPATTTPAPTDALSAFSRGQEMYGTAAQWHAADPVIPAGWLAVETDTGNLKIGDGTSPYTSLGYSGSVGGIVLTGGTVTSVTAGDASIATSGTAADPKIETGTLDQVANLHPPVADWSNNGNRITGLAPGVNPTDAATVSQIGTGGGGGGGSTGQIHTMTAAGTAIAGDTVLANATAAGFTVTLPSAPASNDTVTVRKSDATGNIVTVAPGGTGKIFSPADLTTVTHLQLFVPGDTVVLRYDGTSTWYVVGRAGTPVPGISYITGLVDDTAASDQTAIIQAAINTGPGTYYLREGVIGVSNLSVPINVEIYGAGGGSSAQPGGTVFKTPTGTHPAYNVVMSGANAALTNLDVNSALLGYGGVLLDATGLTLTNMVIQNGTFSAVDSTNNCQQAQLVNVRTVNQTGNLTNRTTGATCSITSGAKDLIDSASGFTALDLGRMIGASVTAIPLATRIVANTTVAAGSEGVNVSTLTGAGTVSVASITHLPSSGTVHVYTGTTSNNRPTGTVGAAATSVASVTNVAVISYTSTSAGQLNGCTLVSGSGVLSAGNAVISTHQVLLDQTANSTISATAIPIVNGYSTIQMGTDWQFDNCRFTQGANILSSGASQYGGNVHFTYTATGQVDICGNIILEDAAFFTGSYLDSVCASGALVVHKQGVKHAQFVGCFTFQNAGPNNNAVFYTENDSSLGVSFVSLYFQNPAKTNVAYTTLVNLASGNNPDVSINDIDIENTACLQATNGIPNLVAGGTKGWGSIGYRGRINWAGNGHIPAQGQADYLYGSGGDGALNFDGTSVVAGLTPSGSVYTLTRDIQATQITVQAAATITCAGFRLLASQFITNLGAIRANGAAGGAAGAAGGAGATGTVLAGGAGGAGQTTAGSAGSSVTAAQGGGGSAGGTGNAGANAAGAAGTATAPTAAQGGTLRAQQLPDALSGAAITAAGVTGWTGGAGGGGGGGDGTNKGGGGGAGGGVLIMAATVINNSGSMRALGGNGGTPTTGNGGGGGGGGGGLVIAASGMFLGTAPSAAGGSAGNGVGTGTAGTAGAAGNVYLLTAA